MKGAVLLPRTPHVTVARGPVPRDCPVDRSMARDRPSPYDEGVAFFNRSAGACPPRLSGGPQHGEGNPLGCACGIRGPSPYVKGAAFFYRIAGPITATLSEL